MIPPDGLTVKQLCEAYLIHPSGGGRLRAASTLPHYRRLIDAEIVPAFGDSRAAAITRTEMREWSERLADGKPVVANRAFAVMRRSYEWALGRDLVQLSPFVGIHKPAAEVPRDRVLSDDEIRAVFDALRHERPIIASLWEMLLRPSGRAPRWRPGGPTSICPGLYGKSQLRRTLAATPKVWASPSSFRCRPRRSPS